MFQEALTSCRSLIIYYHINAGDQGYHGSKGERGYPGAKGEKGIKGQKGESYKSPTTKPPNPPTRRPTLPEEYRTLCPGCEVP